MIYMSRKLVFMRICICFVFLPSNERISLRRSIIMLVTKKKHQEALDRIGDLEKDLEEKNSQLLKKENESEHLKRDYNVLQKQIEETNSTTAKLEELKDQLNNLYHQVQETETSLERIIDEKNCKSLELNNLIEEIKRTTEERYVSSTINERKLVQELNLRLEHQREQANQYSNNIAELEKQLTNKEKALAEYKTLKKSLVLAREEHKLQAVAFYKNIYPFTTTEEFKSELIINSQKQKELIKHKQVVIVGTPWEVNGSQREGREMTNLNVKSMIRSYNTECDNAISSLKYSNYEIVLSRINKSLYSINKLNTKNDLIICEEYHQLKTEELKLIYELKIFEQEEKEKLRVFREEERERKKVEREIMEKTVEYNKHQKEVEKELSALHKKNIETNENDMALLNKIKELYDSLELIEKKRAELEYIHLVGKSGYVYIISNIGAFGEDVYKIGMTRRLEPADRIRELSGAAVPFEYDVHAMILTDDAPHLENHLHTVFRANRVNLVNNRKEFFEVKLEKIKQEVFSIVGRSVVFEDEPVGKNYYESLAIKNGLSSQYANEVDHLLLN